MDLPELVLEEFSGWFNGKTSPVHFFWHGFDLAVTRFSGRPSGNASDDRVTREAYSHEVISFGFWPSDDATISDAAYYSYTGPEPPGLASTRSPWARRFPPAPRPPWRSFPTKKFGRPTIPGGRCLPSARVRTKPARVSPAGT